MNHYSNTFQGKSMQFWGFSRTKTMLLRGKISGLSRRHENRNKFGHTEYPTAIRACTQLLYHWGVTHGDRDDSEKWCCDTPVVRLTTKTLIYLHLHTHDIHTRNVQTLCQWNAGRLVKREDNNDFDCVWTVVTVGSVSSLVDKSRADWCIGSFIANAHN